MKCIFCENELSPQTKPEHILLSSLGGRKTTRQVDCTTCNETFGNLIDNAMGEQIKVLRNMLQLESGTGALSPALKKIKAGKDTINFRNDGKPELVAKPFTVTKNADGTENIEIIARTPEELKKTVAHLAAYLHRPVDEVEKMLTMAKAKRVVMRPGEVHHQLAFGGPEVLRSNVKSCLALWTLAVGNEEVKSVRYEAPRRFVLEGDEAFSKIWAHLDSRDLPRVEEYVARFGKFFNLIYVASDAAGRVIAHFTLYNVIGWHIVLAEAGGAPNAKIALASNPLDPSVWSDKVADELPLDFGWLDSPDYTDGLVRGKERINRAVRHHLETSGADEQLGIFESVFKKHGLRYGDPISDPLVIKKISRELGERLASHYLGLPYEEKLGPEQIAAMLAGEGGA